jgi:hypothetical protein
MVLDLISFTGQPNLIAKMAGGRVFKDGKPVAGAWVWQIGRPYMAVTTETGYFGSSFVLDRPFVVVFGDYWEVVTLEPDIVVDIELTRVGPHPSPPPEPVLVTPKVVGVLEVITPPKVYTLPRVFEIVTPTPQFLIITGIQPLKVFTPLQPLIFPTPTGRKQ